MCLPLPGWESQLSRFPNLESLTFECYHAGPIKQSAAATCPTLRVLHIGGYFNAASEADLLAVLRGCVQLRELKCILGKYGYSVPIEIRSLTALTSLSLWYNDRRGAGNDNHRSITLIDAMGSLVCLQKLTQ